MQVATSINSIQDQVLTDKLRELVLERLKRIPEDMEMSIGDMDYSKKELLTHVSEGDEVGKEVVSMQIEFLQDLASGSIYADE
jgi:hypothetical protein